MPGLKRLISANFTGVQPVKQMPVTFKVTGNLQILDPRNHQPGRSAASAFPCQPKMIYSPAVNARNPTIPKVSLPQLKSRLEKMAAMITIPAATITIP